MGRNRLAGTKRGNSNSAKFYQDNPEARERKKKYDTKYHSTTERKKYRASLQKINRAKGTHGNLDGIDEDHVTRSRTRKREQSSNRGDKKRRIF